MLLYFLTAGLQGLYLLLSKTSTGTAIVDISPPFHYGLAHSRTTKMEHRYTHNLKLSPPPMRNILIVYYSIRFRAECPEKNGKNRRFCKRICIVEIMVFVDISPLIAGTIVRTTEFSSNRIK